MDREERTIPPCPICQGDLVTVYEKFHQLTAVCQD